MILDGKKVSDNILKEVKEQTDELSKKSIFPTLAILRVGNDVGSISYERSILARLKPLGIKVDSYVLEEDISEEEFIDQLDKLNNDDEIDSILVFKPLPKQINNDKVIYQIDPFKDVDCMNPTNLGKLMINDDLGFYPCTAEGIIELLDFYDFDVKGKDVVIINNSDVIGKPLAILLSNRFATVTICHEFTKDLKKFTKNADIIVTAAGVQDLIVPEMLNKDQTLIDAAVTLKRDKERNPILDKNGKAIRVGDSREDCKDLVENMISVTPGCGGGTGSITTSLLAKNIVKAAKNRKE